MPDDFVHDIYPLTQAHPIRPHPSNVREERKGRKESKEKKDKKDKEKKRSNSLKKLEDKISITTTSNKSFKDSQIKENKKIL